MRAVSDKRRGAGAGPARCGGVIGRLALACVLAFAAAGVRTAAAQEADTAARIVRGLRFEGNRALDSERLAASIATTSSDWFATFGLVRWMGFGEKRRFDENEFVRDVIRLRLLYRASGYPDAKIDTLVVRERRAREVSVFATFRITEGTPVRVATFEVTGLDSVPPKVRAGALLDLPLRVGDPFDRVRLQASIDTITRRLRNAGYPDADIFREFTSDAPRHVASVALTVVTGPLATFGTIRVEGASRVDSAFVRGLTGLRPGVRYSQDRLLQSQRLLYRTDLFRFSAVGADSAQARAAGDSVVPLVIGVQEAPPTRLRLGAGYGTTDCFRASSGLLLRNFAGEGRLLEFSARVSKLGVGTPTDAGLARNLCRQLAEDSIGSQLLNYTLQGTLRRPGFLGFQNTLAFSAFVERRSEFKVYRREEFGLGVSLSRETPSRRFPLTLGYTIASGRTTALPASFCFAFSACTPEIIALQQERRRLGLLTLSATMPRANSLVDPTRGSNVSIELAHSDTWLGSSSLNQFTRAIVDAAFYHELGRNVVLSGRVHGGVIFSPRPPAGTALDSLNASFVPLEQRFFGGGPNDVRGFQRNQLGPVVYVVRDSILSSVGGRLDSLRSDQVTVSATGGNTLAVGNLELRVPSPIFASRMRLAVFVDGGAVWQRGVNGVSPAFRVTPGAGVRFGTPLGPFRLDLAYNRDGAQPGRLFSANKTTGDLTQVADAFALPRRSFPFTLHVSVGQPF